MKGVVSMAADSEVPGELDWSPRLEVVEPYGVVGGFEVLGPAWSRFMKRLGRQPTVDAPFMCFWQPSFFIYWSYSRQFFLPLAAVSSLLGRKRSYEARSRSEPFSQLWEQVFELAVLVMSLKLQV